MDGAMEERRGKQGCYDKLLKSEKQVKLKEIKSSN